MVKILVYHVLVLYNIPPLPCLPFPSFPFPSRETHPLKSTGRRAWSRRKSADADDRRHPLFDEDCWPGMTAQNHGDIGMLSLIVGIGSTQEHAHGYACLYWKILRRSYLPCLPWWLCGHDHRKSWGSTPSHRRKNCVMLLSVHVWRLISRAGKSISNNFSLLSCKSINQRCPL